jgi:hypothetical protein
MVLINLIGIKSEPQTVRRAQPLISTQRSARPGAALVIGGEMPETETGRLCESCLASIQRQETPATTHSTNPDFSGYDLCAECAAEYDSRPTEHMAGDAQAGAL